MDSETAGHRHQVSSELLDTRRGLWLVKVTFFALLLGAVIEGVVAALSGSAALLADTVHGLSNAFTTLPLWIAFYLGQKKPTSEYTYGYHRAEDVAGIVIIIFIAVSAGLVGLSQCAGSWTSRIRNTYHGRWGPGP